LSFSRRSLLRDALRSLQRLPLDGWATELFFEHEKEREVSWSEGRPKTVSSGVGSGVSVRVVKNGRQGFASGTNTSALGVHSLFDLACESARFTFPDKTRRLPSVSRKGTPLSMGRDQKPVLDFPYGEKDLLGLLKRLERMALKGDRRLKKALSLTFHEASGVHAIVNSRGISVAEPWSTVSFSAEVLGAAGKETETAWGSTEKRQWADLDPRGVVEDVRARLLTSFGARPIPSGLWPVIVTPRVGVDVVELFSQAVLGDAVQKGRSFLTKRLGKRVGSPLTTFIDDGRLRGGVAAGVWDDEGVPKQRTVVLERGFLRTYLHDTVTAVRAQVASTGNASRSGRETPPSPGVTNFCLAPGACSVDELYRSTPRAFVVRDVIGMHTADPVSGDFSVGASGILWEKGMGIRAVRGVTLSGNMLDLLSGVDAVADDLSWQGTYGAPTFRVKGLSVGGS
jgi:PmbA protein